MSYRTFAVTWDYRCPFARNFCEHVIVGMEAGADRDVTFAPFSLDQAHVGEGKPDVWDRPVGVRKEHERLVDDHAVFGVPTVIVHGRAVFIRVMDRPGDDAELAVGTVERALDLILGWPELNEFKHTTIPR